MRSLRKIAALVLLFLLCPCLVFAGDDDQLKKRRKKKKKTAFEQGQFDLQLGAGLPSLVSAETDTLKYFGDLKIKSQPVYQFRGSYGILSNVSVGWMMGLTFSQAEYTDNTDPDNINGFKFTAFVIGARAAYHHLVTSEKFDPYVAGFAGFNAMSTKPYGEDNPIDIEHRKFLWSIHGGANFYFLDKLGAFAEVGYGVSYVNFGITLKL